MKFNFNYLIKILVWFIKQFFRLIPKRKYKPGPSPVTVNKRLDKARKMLKIDLEGVEANV